MSFDEVNFLLVSGDRQNMRITLIGTMLKEKPGNGNGDKCSRYQYNVESFQEYGIFLKRPTRLNKGFDFTVNTKRLWFKKNRRYSNPSHKDIFNALEDCKSNYEEEYSLVIGAIQRIYNCEDVDFSVPTGLTFHDFEGTEHPIEIIIFAVKWLFMEQDCAYWNYSGRALFYSALRERKLA
ncbi:MAG: hypothetical protein VB048_05280 [Bacteroidaceae bacterium]|nr:hypothetical protein [Bacteroidaceae bacterium]MEA5018006.1 hypothetical protein [Erysipelotrichaceae bacterium]